MDVAGPSYKIPAEPPTPEPMSCPHCFLSYGQFSADLLLCLDKVRKVRLGLSHTNLGGPFGNAGFWVGKIGYITAKITQTGVFAPQPPPPF